MKAMFAGFAAIAVICVASWAALTNMGFSTQSKYSAPSVRVD